MSRSRTLLPLAALALPACTADAPASPSYQRDVAPILAANCLRCHGAPALGGASAGLRLDSYSDLAVPDPRDPAAERPILGAATYAAAIALRAADPVSPMPPRFPLDDWQVEVLERWAAAGAPRGAPRPGNRPPAISIEDVTSAGGALAIRARVTDPDDDVVAGTLRVVAGTGGGAGRPLVGAVRSGLVDLTWSPASVPPGTYPLVALLDDGAAVHELDAGSITVPPP
jgi:hypothetical protein